MKRSIVVWVDPQGALNASARLLQAPRAHFTPRSLKQLFDLAVHSLKDDTARSESA
jgi:hypothetical protein